MGGCQGLLPCQTQQVPADSATDPLQDTAESISQVGGAFVKIYFRKERKKVRGEEKNRKSETTEGTSTLEKEGEDVLQGTQQVSTVTHEDSMLEQVF